MNKQTIMKNIIFTLTLLISFNSFGQYSNYYNSKVDANVNAYIEKDINVNASVTNDINFSGNINKTITTIDRGALANANALAERNRIESLKLENENERAAMIQIAIDPINAYTYGEDLNFQSGISSKYGYQELEFEHKIPHKVLFEDIGWWDYQNISENFIETILTINNPASIHTIYDADDRKKMSSYHNKPLIDSLGLEGYAKRPNLKVGEYNNEAEMFLHKKNISRATVYGRKGFKTTLIVEDDYEYIIQDIYNALNYDGAILTAKVEYKSNKNDANFEEIEGRRYYMRRLVEKIIATAQFYGKPLNKPIIKQKSKKQQKKERRSARRGK